MELKIHTNRSSGHWYNNWDYRHSIEFNCDLCDFGAMTNSYNDDAVEQIKEMAKEHLNSSHEQSTVVNHVIDKMFESMEIYGNKAVNEKEKI